MKTVFQKRLDRFAIFFTSAALVLLTLLLLASEIFEQQPLIQGDIIGANGRTDTLQTFSNAYIVGPGKIRIKESSTKMKYLAPRVTIDPMYALLFFINAIIIVFFFWDFSYKNPFTKKALRGLQIGFAILLVFFVANLFRYQWFDEQVRSLTNGQYSYERQSPLASPEFWILLVLVRLMMIFKNGVRLQQDTNLTI
jgi:glucan phosphoethanolaminetransferase (alkaline phosphatase superfamily)